MDGKTFDRWIGELASRPTGHATSTTHGRRVFICGALASLVAPLLARQESAAKNKGGKGGKGGKGKGKCKSGTKKCGNKCIAESKCCTDADCSLCREQVCSNGTCGCAPGAFEYNGVCGVQPLCLTVAQLCETDADCCSGHCDVRADNGDLRCNRGVAKCITDLDCLPGFTCQGFSCSANPPCN